LLTQELVKLAHNWVEDADSMSSNGVKHLVNTDSAHLLRLLCLLDEHLLVEVVAVVTYKDLSILKQVHDVDALIELLCGQVRRHDRDTKLVLGQLSHVLVSAEVMGRQCRHSVEHAAEVLLNLIAHVDLFLEEVEIVHARVLRQIANVLLYRVDLVQVRNHDLMDLNTQLFFSDTADRLCYVLSECLIHFLLVEIDGALRVLQMSDVVKHVKGIAQGHQEVVHLVESVTISDNLLQEEWEQGAMPVKEAAACRFANHDLPAGDHLKLLVPVTNVLELLLGEDLGADQVQAVTNDGLAKLVVATLVTLNNVHHELHHVALQRCVLLLHRVHFLHATLNHLHNVLTRIPIDQDDPLVNQEFLRFELDFDSLKHLDGLNDDGERLFGQRSIILLE